MARFIKYDSSKAFLSPTKESLDGIEEAIRWAEWEVPRNLRKEMNKLVFHMALVNQGEARKMSFGPYDPSGSNSGLAWKLPVRRISDSYYLGWKVRSVGSAAWQLYNASREAYFIEFGINWLGKGRRVRRPIRKLSLRRTMEIMMTTQVYHRVWCDIYADPRHRHRGMGFTQIVQSPGAQGLWENVSDHEAAGIARRTIRAGTPMAGMRKLQFAGQSQWQVRRQARGGGSYTGPGPGRKLP